MIIEMERLRCWVLKRVGRKEMGGESEEDREVKLCLRRVMVDCQLAIGWSLSARPRLSFLLSLVRGS